MPAPAPRQQPYPGNVHRLADAAALGQLIVIRCGLCRRGANYLAADLVSLLGAHRDALEAPFPCSKCERTDYIKVRLRLPRPGDYGNLVVRRPGPVRRIQTWQSVKLGDQLASGDTPRYLRYGSQALTEQGDVVTAKANRRPLLVIDGDSFAHRAYHGLPKTVRRAGDKGGGAIVGFANYLIRLWESEQPRAVFVGWDTLEEPNWRAKLFAPYQGGREFDDEIVDQLNVLPEFVRACGFLTGRAAGFEADDFLATAAALEEKAGGTVLVASGDRDSFQLASDHTTILYPVKMGEMARFGPAEVRERYGVEPGQVPDFIALRGDPSDKIPGARGIGEKTAASLLKSSADLEAILAGGRFEAQAEDLRLYRRIATMVTNAPVPKKIPDVTPTWDKAAALAREWELNNLSERLGLLAAG